VTLKPAASRTHAIHSAQASSADELKSIIEPPGNPHRVRSGPYAEVGPLDCSDVARVSTASKVKRPSGAAGVEMSAKFWRLLSDSDRIPEGPLWSWREELADQGSHPRISANVGYASAQSKFIPDQVLF
jgi:hypothetical protein